MADLFASRLPGRLRIRHRTLRDRTRNAALAAEFTRWSGVLSAEGNPATGSLLLTYDAARVPPAEIEAAVVAAVAPPAAAEAPPSPPSTPSAARRVSLLRRANRLSKIGMLGTLGLSLAALGVSKRLHAASGGAYLALLLVHLAANRRYLLK